jgi:hypothetical protein
MLSVEFPISVVSEWPKSKGEGNEHEDILSLCVCSFLVLFCAGLVMIAKPVLGVFLALNALLIQYITSGFDEKKSVADVGNVSAKFTLARDLNILKVILSLNDVEKRCYSIDVAKLLPETKREDKYLWDIVGCEPTKNKDEIIAAYKRTALICHPDRGGNVSLFNVLTESKDTLISRYTS